MGIEDVIIIGVVGGEDPVMQYFVRQIDEDLSVPVKKVLVIEQMQGAEHGSVRHVVSIENRIGIGKVLFVVILRVNRTGELRSPVRPVAKIKIQFPVRPGLTDGIIDISLRNQNPGISIRSCLPEFLKIDRDPFRRLRRYDRDGSFRCGRFCCRCSISTGFFCSRGGGSCRRGRRR